MLGTYLMCVRQQLRRPAVLIWTLAFPVILATLFKFMFAGISSGDAMQPVRVAVVADAEWSGSPFSLVVDALSADGDSAGDAADAETGAALLDVREVSTAEAADELLDDGEVCGAYGLDADGMPTLTLSSRVSSSSSYEVDRAILETVASSYEQTYALMEDVARDNPSALASEASARASVSVQAGVERVSLTRSAPDETVRFYYALLGMAALFTAQVAADAVAKSQPNLTPQGARVSVSGTGRGRRLAGALLGSWTVSLLCLLAAFAYVRLVVGVDFSGREPLAVCGLAAASLLATAIGTFVGLLPLKGGLAARSGIITCLTCLFSVFAGLYGDSCMRLADDVARAIPASVWANPARLVSDLFYDLYYYESLVPFAARVAACAAISAALLGLGTIAFRRQRYEHL